MITIFTVPNVNLHGGQGVGKGGVYAMTSKAFAFDLV